MVEHWFPKPKARGSSPFFPVLLRKKAIDIPKQLS